MKFNGQALRAAREAKGLTQEQLAAAIDGTFGTISKLERGVGGEPRLSTITKLARALDVPAPDLVSDEEADRAVV
jgi:XRE family transcriptional regulator, fatty acid utilization regulator